MSNDKVKENKKSKGPLLVRPTEAFLIYFQLRGKRSLKRLHKEINQKYAKSVKEGRGGIPHINTLKKWSDNHKWQDKLKHWDATKDVKEKDETIDEVVLENKMLMNICKAWINQFAKRSKGTPMKDKFGNPILDQKGNIILVPPYIDPFGFKAVWEVYQVLRGEATERIAFTKDDQELLASMENANDEQRKKIFKYLAGITAIKDEIARQSNSSDVGHDDSEQPKGSL